MVNIYFLLALLVFDEENPMCLKYIFTNLEQVSTGICSYIQGSLIKQLLLISYTITRVLCSAKVEAKFSVYNLILTPLDDYNDLCKNK